MTHEEQVRAAAVSAAAAACQGQSAAAITRMAARLAAYIETGRK